MLSTTRVSWLKYFDRAVFLVLLVAYVLPIWRHRYFPTQDGPLHVGNAAIIRHYWDPEPNAFRAAYTLDLSLRSNYLGHYILAGLLTVARPEIAEKILITGYAVLLPVGFAYALTAVAPHGLFLAVLSFPFVYNYLLHMGFYNFSLCFLIYVFMLGVYLRHRNGFSRNAAMKLGALGLLGVLAHVTSVSAFMVAFAVLVTMNLAPDVLRWKRGLETRERLKASIFAKAVMPTLGLLPLVLMLLSFFREYGATGMAYLPKATMWNDFIHFRSLVSFWPTVEEPLATWLVRLLAAVGVYGLVYRLRTRSWEARDGLLVLAVVYFALYFFAPNYNSAGGAINWRLMLYPFVALLLWLATFPIVLPVRLAVQAGGCVIALAFILHFDGIYRRANVQLDEFMAASRFLEPNSTLYPIDLDGGGVTPEGATSYRVSIFHTTAGYMAAERRIIDLRNIEGVERHCPTKFTSAYNPGGRVQFEMPGVNPTVDLMLYGKQTGHPIDYVLLWGAPVGGLKTNVESIIAQIEAQGYEAIFTSPKAATKLFRRVASEKLSKLR